MNAGNDIRFIIAIHILHQGLIDVGIIDPYLKLQIAFLKLTRICGHKFLY